MAGPNAMRCAVGAALVAVAATARTGRAEQAPVDPNPALEKLEQAIDELEPWRKSLVAGQQVDEKNLQRLTQAAQRLFRQFEPIIEQQRQERIRSVQQANQRQASSREQAQAWIDAIRALGPDAKPRHTAALGEVRAALQSGDADRQLAGLQTLRQTGDVAFDKAPFRELLLPIVREATDGAILEGACYALFNTGRQPGDLALVEAVWERRSPALDYSMSHLLASFGDGVIAGRSEEIVLELLAAQDASFRREALRGLWGATVSDRLAARLVELADDPQSRHDAIYFGLSTLKVKNEAVVDKLIETLADPDWNNWDRALWGLGYGVEAPALQKKVAAALTDMYAARSDPQTRETCRRLIEQYGGKEAVEKLPK